MVPVYIQVKKKGAGPSVHSIDAERGGEKVPLFRFLYIVSTVVPFYIRVKKKEGWSQSTFDRCRERSHSSVFYII